MSEADMRCDDCGRFVGEAASWAAIYDFKTYEQIYEHQRCPRCTEKLGSVESNAQPYNGDMSPFQGIRSAPPAQEG